MYLGVRVNVKVRRRSRNCKVVTFKKLRASVHENGEALSELMVLSHQTSILSNVLIPKRLRIKLKLELSMLQKTQERR